MIDKGFLKNAYINESTREVVLPSSILTATNASQSGANMSATEIQTRVVACPCCGANNTVSGTLGECEYGGAPLK